MCFELNEKVLMDELNWLEFGDTRSAVIVLAGLTRSFNNSVDLILGSVYCCFKHGWSIMSL